MRGTIYGKVFVVYSRAVGAQGVTEFGQSTMKKYVHLREKARVLRQGGATLPEICERLALNKSTVYGWIKDIPIPPTAKQSEQRRKAAQAIRQKHEAQRQKWYNEGQAEAVELLRNSQIRDFVVLYAAEGYKRNRNHVSICNSNPGIVQIAHICIRQLTNNIHIRYQLQCHVDNDVAELKRYWAKLLGIGEQQITVSRKSNAGSLRGRQWRSQYGVLTIDVGDTQLRCKIQAWLDYLQQEWLRD